MINSVTWSGRLSKSITNFAAIYQHCCFAIFNIPVPTDLLKSFLPGLVCCTKDILSQKFFGIFIVQIKTVTRTYFSPLTSKKHVIAIYIGSLCQRYVNNLRDHNQCLLRLVLFLDKMSCVLLLTLDSPLSYPFSHWELFYNILSTCYVFNVMLH